MLLLVDGVVTEAGTHQRPHLASKLLRRGTKAASRPRELGYCSAAPGASEKFSSCCQRQAANWGASPSEGAGTAICDGVGSDAIFCCCCCCCCCC